MMTDDVSDLWARAAAGDLDAIEAALGQASTARLLGLDRSLSGAEAGAAFRSVRQEMPDLVASGRTDSLGEVVVVWLDLQNLPWLPQAQLRSVVRVTEGHVEVLGGLEQLLAEASRRHKPETASSAPSALHPNALILRAGYDNPSIHATIFSEEFVAHTPGRNPIAGDWQGAGPMAEHLSRIRKLSGDSMRVEPLTRFALANDGFGVVFSRATAQRGSQSLDQYVCGVWRFDQGRIAEHWELVSDPSAWDSFWNLSDPA